MKTKLKSIHLILLPILNIPAIMTSIINIPRYFKFLKDYFSYRLSTINEKVPLLDLYPCLDDVSSDSQTGKGHYFYQDLWALRHVKSFAPDKHIDVGSRIDGFSAQCSILCPVEFIDYRPVDLRIPNFKMTQGLITKLPFPSNSVKSISSLHVVEHIGLGRYGDPVDPKGSIKAIKELQRVLALEGQLLFSVPIGRERVQFNAHRVFNPKSIIQAFDQLQLLSFAVVNDNNEFLEKANPSDNWNNQSYACGLFLFKKINT